MKTVEYYPKGTTVYYFSGYTFMLIETVVKEIDITIFGKNEHKIVYTLSGTKDSDIKLASQYVHEDRNILKELVLNNFQQEEALSDDNVS